MFFYGGKDTTYFNTLCGNRKNFLPSDLYSHTHAHARMYLYSNEYILPAVYPNIKGSLGQK